MSREKYNLYLYYVSSKNWEPGTCWGQRQLYVVEGDWSHVRYMT